jgi:hypothetical protein
VTDNERCKLVKTRDVIFPLSDNTNTGLELVEIEDGPSNLCKSPSTPKLEETEEELDNLQIKQNLPAPVIIEQSPQLSPSPGPALRRSARLQSIASQLVSDSESEDELLLTDRNANPNGNIATALYHALAAFAAPDTYLQARHSPEWSDWSNAMSNELAKMDKYKVWDVVDQQSKMQVVGARWVYTRKIDGTTGLPSTYKARWVAKGYSQLGGIDYNELYAAVAHKDTI